MTTLAQDRKLAAPVVEPGTEAFWNATAEGKLLIKRCEACSRLHWYPRALCPHCLSDRTAWVQSSGHGTIHSFSVTRRPGPAYAIAYVTLDDGVTMLTNIVDCDLDAIRIGDRVQVVFKPTEGGGAVPMFKPSRATSAAALPAPNDR
jgi:uncharacterized OB-fold protein